MNKMFEILQVKQQQMSVLADHDPPPPLLQSNDESSILNACGFYVQNTFKIEKSSVKALKNRMWWSISIVQCTIKRMYNKL